MESDGIMVCRLCLKSCDRFIDIFDPNGTDGLLVWKVLKELLQIDVCKEDGLPVTICRVCMKKISEFKFFKTVCINSRIEFLKAMVNSGMVACDRAQDFPLPRVGISRIPEVINIKDECSDDDEPQEFSDSLSQGDKVQSDSEESELNSDGGDLECSSVIITPPKKISYGENVKNPVNSRDVKSVQISRENFNPSKTYSSGTFLNSPNSMGGKSTLKYLGFSDAIIKEVSKSPIDKRRDVSGSIEKAMKRREDVQSIGEGVTVESAIGQHVCPHCNRSFRSNKGMLIHLKAKHRRRVIGVKKIQSKKCFKQHTEMTNEIMDSETHETSLYTCKSTRNLKVKVCKVIMGDSLKKSHRKNLESIDTVSTGTVCRDLDPVHYDYTKSIHVECEPNFSSDQSFDLSVLRSKEQYSELGRVVSGSGTANMDVPKNRRRGQSFRLGVTNVEGSISSFTGDVYACELCPMKFKFQARLRDHIMSIHEKSKQYKCKFCGKVSTTVYNNKRHELCHSDIRPYLCVDCPATYKSSWSLRFHRRKFHGNCDK